MGANVGDDHVDASERVGESVGVVSEEKGGIYRQECITFVLSRNDLFPLSLYISIFSA